ncbi:MAG TPA: sodium/solute symporter [Planctomycetota bacterium]|jgi:SSS family transporter|nr:sodium/solute symporter [Planctomycetota bacterium]
MNFQAADWAVLGLYLLGTSWLAEKLAGRRQTVRDFFLGGRRLPWWAVCGSIVASEISGVTFVSVPAMIYAAGGDFRYLLFAVGSIAARVAIGFWVLPAYYRSEIYSPYEFMGQQLGAGVQKATTALFLLGGFLAQGVRLFLAALVLDSITGMGLPAAIAAMGAVSIVWTWMGGINSVVWTDLVQFVILFVGALAAIVAVAAAVPGGLGEIFQAGREAGKFRWMDLSLDPRAEFTLWTGLFGFGAMTLASHGTDQMMAQRLFCCATPREARRAIVASSVGLLLTPLMLLVGVGVYAYFRRHPMAPADATLVAERVDYVFPVFIRQAMPVGVKGLLFAAIFSAATATSTLSAMAQAMLGLVERPLREKGCSERTLVRVSRLLVLLAGAGLCGVALLCAQLYGFKDLLRLAFKMASYTYGAMLGILLLALRPGGRDGRGLLWGVPFALLLSIAFSWRNVPGIPYAVAAACGILALSALAALGREWPRALGAVAAAAAVTGVAFRPDLQIADPWLYPVGAIVAFGLGRALGRKRLAASEPASVS